MPIEDLKLREAQPSDRPHLLLWDTPNDQELKALAYRENADFIPHPTSLAGERTGCYQSHVRQYF
jgi:hypothetical protein